MIIHESVFNNILESFSMSIGETGGILGSVDGIVSAYYHDAHPQCSSIDEYVPNVVSLNLVLQDWQSEGIELAGIIHSHPVKSGLSMEDLAYAQAILSSCKTKDRMYFPLWMPPGLMTVYAVSKTPDGYCTQKEDVDIIPG